MENTPKKFEDHLVSSMEYKIKSNNVKEILSFVEDKQKKNDGCFTIEVEHTEGRINKNQLQEGLNKLIRGAYIDGK